MKFQLGDVVEVKGNKGVVVRVHEDLVAVGFDTHFVEWMHPKQLKLLARSKPVERKQVEAWANVYKTGMTLFYDTQEQAKYTALHSLQEFAAVAVHVEGEYEVTE